jgi:hypothetical protein
MYFRGWIKGVTEDGKLIWKIEQPIVVNFVCRAIANLFGFKELLITFKEPGEYVSDFPSEISSAAYNLNKLEIIEILLQTGFACYAMGLSGLTHNDLSNRPNTYVKVLDNPNKEWITYVIGSPQISYSFSPSYKVMVYDFDRAYAERLGDNPTLESNLCSDWNQCNILIPNKDFLSVILTNKTFFSDEELVYLLSKKGSKNSTELASNLIRSRFGKFMRKIDNSNLTLEEYDFLSSTEEIIWKLARMSKFVEIGYEDYDLPSLSENIFTCIPKMFHRDGTLKK